MYLPYSIKKLYKDTNVKLLLLYLAQRSNNYSFPSEIIKKKKKKTRDQFLGHPVQLQSIRFCVRMKASVVKTRGTFRHVIWSCGREQELSKQLDVSSVSSIKVSILEGSEIGDRQRGNKYYFRFRLKGWSYLPRMGRKILEARPLFRPER